MNGTKLRKQAKKLAFIASTGFMSCIITSAGAIWFCVAQNRCESHITNPDIASVNNPTWWVQFVSGTPNANRPTAADCTAPSGGGDLAGVVSGGRTEINLRASGSVDAPDLTLGEQINQLWVDTGFMRWPLAFCLVLGIPLGIVAARSDRFENLLRPVLDAILPASVQVIDPAHLDRVEHELPAHRPLQEQLHGAPVANPAGVYVRGRADARDRLVCTQSKT